MSHEFAAQWRKSNHSSHEGGDCVEIAELSGRIGVRDSKNPSSRIHIFGKASFRTFTQALREGRSDC